MSLVSLPGGIWKFEGLIWKNWIGSWKKYWPLIFLNETSEIPNHVDKDLAGLLTTNSELPATWIGIGSGRTQVLRYRYLSCLIFFPHFLNRVAHKRNPPSPSSLSQEWSQAPTSVAAAFRPANDPLPGPLRLAYSSGHKGIHELICRDLPARQSITIIRTRKTSI